MGKVTFNTNRDALNDTDFIVEAVIENIDLNLDKFHNLYWIKKVTPTKFSGRLDANVISVMESDEVLLAKIVDGLHAAPKSSYRQGSI